jgi:hypothetical protein
MAESTRHNKPEQNRDRRENLKSHIYGYRSFVDVEIVLTSGERIITVLKSS